MSEIFGTFAQLSSSTMSDILPYKIRKNVNFMLKNLSMQK